MKLLFFIVVLLFYFQGCDSSKKKNFDLTLEAKGSKINEGTKVKYILGNKKNKIVDSAVFLLNDKKLNHKDSLLDFTGASLGKYILKAMVYYEGNTEEIKKRVTVLAYKAPEVYMYQIINTYKHSETAFTQGLEFYKDTLYESTGQRGKSALRRFNYKTGEEYGRISLDRQYFGEGLTILGNKIYQLTWQSKKGFIYDLKNFRYSGSFSYGQSKEGWGLCNDGKVIYKSDGTSKIWLLDPDTLEETGTIQTVTDKAVFSKANELEYAKGKIYANTWQRDGVMIINPQTGAIEGVVDFRGLKKKVRQHDQLDVLNGIAYNQNTNTFFVTGKNWGSLFEVRIVKKE